MFVLLIVIITQLTFTGTTTSTVDMDFVVFSNHIDQQPLLLLNSGNNAKNITCTKTNGSISELRVETVDQNGIVTAELLYTNADNCNHIKIWELKSEKWKFTQKMDWHGKTLT